MNKQELRENLLRQRKQISDDRKALAAQTLKKRILKDLVKASHILSYASFGDELNTHPLNEVLAKERRLLLPRINGSSLDIFFVTDPNKQLKEHRFGFGEPRPQLCEKGRIEDLSAILVPALGFDGKNHRLGYGKGYYDRLLSLISGEVLTIGISYQELKISPPIPVAPHDISVQEVVFC